jgi:DNA-binding MurR/RpiR family transcriptional regulator
MLPSDVVARVARRLRRSKRVDVFGSGVSGLIAEMLSYRLLRAGCNAIAMRDAVLAHEVSSGLDNTSAVIAISQSGSTPETIKFVQNARRAGAFSLAITPPARRLPPRQTPPPAPRAAAARRRDAGDGTT